jgi:hypothetical protein
MHSQNRRDNITPLLGKSRVICPFFNMLDTATAVTQAQRHKENSDENVQDEAKDYA